MELCAARPTSSLARLPQTLNQTETKTLFLAPKTIQPHFNFNKISLPLKHTSRKSIPGLLCYNDSPLSSTSEDEKLTGATSYIKDEPASVESVEVENGYGETIKNEEVKVEVSPLEVYSENAQNEGSTDKESSEDSQTQFLEFLDKLDIKFDSDDTYSILLFGGGALIVLWLATAVIGAIDSIPVFPKLLEVVGLGYSIWFSTRYLIFKKSREELVDKTEEIKKQVLGTNDD